MNQYDKPWELSLYFTSYTLFILISYIIWFIRILFLPLNAPIVQWIWLWKVSIILLAISPIFLIAFSLSLSELRNKKFLLVLSLFPIIILLIELFVIFDTHRFSISNLSIVTYQNYDLGILIVSILILSYFIFPSKFFWNYLTLKSNKNSNSYKRAQLTLLSLITASISVFVLLFQISIFVNEYFYLLGNLVMIGSGLALLLSLKLYNPAKLSDFDI